VCTNTVCDCESVPEEQQVRRLCTAACRLLQIRSGGILVATGGGKQEHSNNPLLNPYSSGSREQVRI
jgi:hypothetical protein